MWWLDWELLCLKPWKLCKLLQLNPGVLGELWIKKLFQSIVCCIRLNLSTQDFYYCRLGMKPSSWFLHLQYTSLLLACTNQFPQSQVSSVPIDVLFFTLKCHSMTCPLFLWLQHLFCYRPPQMDLDARCSAESWRIGIEKRGTKKL